MLYYIYFNVTIQYVIVGKVPFIYILVSSALANNLMLYFVLKHAFFDAVFDDFVHTPL